MDTEEAKSESFNLYGAQSTSDVQGRQGNVTFKPYRDIRTKPLKKRAIIPETSKLLGSVSDHLFSKVTAISDLYPELLCLIFSHLDTASKGRAAQVCRRWQSIFNTKEIWKGCEARLHLRRLDSDEKNDLTVPCFVRRGIRKVQILSVGRKSLRDLMPCLPTLTKLDLSGCFNLTDPTLATLLQQELPCLVSMNLSLCKELTDGSLGRIATHCKNLSSLQLGGCTGVTNKGLLFLVQGLSKIKDLNLRSCWQVSDVGLSYLAGLSAPPDTPAPLHPRMLEYLNLQDCQKLTDASLRYISQGLDKIRMLNLSSCANISDSGMKSLARMSSLASLNLRSCDNISDIGVGYLAEGCVGLQNLDVSFCERVTDRALIHIASGLFSLRTLSMAACKITDEGISRISKTLLELQTLNIGQCGGITDLSLQMIGARLQQLRSIDLYGCNKVTKEQGVAILLHNCPEMLNINFELWH